MQCLVYACQIEPALPEEEAAGLAKLLLGMADGLQGFVSVSHTQKTMTPCVLQAIQHRLLYASACSAHMHTHTGFAVPALGSSCRVFVSFTESDMHGLCIPLTQTD